MIDTEVRHLYQVGELVVLDSRAGYLMKSDLPFTVVAQLPPAGRDFQYRIRGIGERHERVALEHNLTPLASLMPDGLSKQPDGQMI